MLDLLFKAYLYIYVFMYYVIYLKLTYEIINIIKTISHNLIFI